MEGFLPLFGGVIVVFPVPRQRRRAGTVDHYRLAALLDALQRELAIVGEELARRVPDRMVLRQPPQVRAGHLLDDVTELFVELLRVAARLGEDEAAVVQVRL